MRGAGRVVFVAILLLMVGTLNIIYGIGAISDANFYVNDTRYIFTNLHTMGWVLVILGVIQLTGGFSLMAGNAYGRVDRHRRRQPRSDRRAAVDGRSPPVLGAGDLRPLRLDRLRNRRVRRGRASHARLGLGSREPGHPAGLPRVPISSWPGAAAASARAGTSSRPP